MHQDPRVAQLLEGTDISTAFALAKYCRKLREAAGLPPLQGKQPPRPRTGCQNNGFMGGLNSRREVAAMSRKDREQNQGGYMMPGQPQRTSFVFFCVDCLYLCLCLCLCLCPCQTDLFSCFGALVFFVFIVFLSLYPSNTKTIPLKTTYHTTQFY